MSPVRLVGLGLAVVACLSVARPARAQESGDGFLFRAPRGEVSIRGGFNHATAGSDLFSFTTSQLTLTPHDFSSLMFATDVDVALTARLSARFGFSFSQSTTPSEFRDFVDNNRQPIQQIHRVPAAAADGEPQGLSVEARPIDWPLRLDSVALRALRRRRGWRMWYRFRQRGDFIDFATFKVFPDTSTPTAGRRRCTRLSAPTSRSIPGSR